MPGGAAAASRLVEIAHHWTAAHEPSEALPAAIAAGDASRSVFAYGEATRQFELAIELWDLCDPADRPADRDLVGLFDAASASAILVGDASRAMDHARHALDLVDAITTSDATADRERRARAWERLGGAAWLAGDTATSINALEEAVGLLDGTPAITIRGARPCRTRREPDAGGPRIRIDPASRAKPWRWHGPSATRASSPGR